jgi:hypothetical protein
MSSTDRDSDVVVVGSGGAALLAAATAAQGGCAVTVLERSAHFGGTTSVSGGLVWIPLNRFLAQAGVEETRAGAINYMTRLAAGHVAPEIIETYVDNAHLMVDYLEERTSVRVAPMPEFPDYHPDFEGACQGGRGLESLPFDAGLLGEHAHSVRISPYYTALTLSELKSGVSDPGIIPWDRAAGRIRGNVRTLGSALVCGLLKACKDAGVRLLSNVRVRTLVVDGYRATGVEAENAGGEMVTFLARRGVILGSGGFDWNEKMKARLLGLTGLVSSGVPSNEGDGLTMALRAGASLTGTREAWWEPLGAIPGEHWSEGGQIYRPNVAERTLPGSVMVNRAGRRFVNEAMNYHDLSRSMMAFDAISYDYPNRVAWTVFDQAFKDRYVVMTSMPGDPAPEWLAAADSLPQLAAKVGIDPDGLVATIARFNRFARAGVDEDFHRGESTYDRYQADARHKPNRSLGPLDQPPYYALDTMLGIVGTKTGLDITPRAEVLSSAGSPIPGLFACSNLVAAAITGPAIPGPGGTLGPALTFGYLAGLNARHG